MVCREHQFDALTGDEDDEGPPDVVNQRDEIGLIRTITIKVLFSLFGYFSLFICATIIQERSSAKRKQIFLDLQKKAGQKPPLQLLVDMPVRWSSTYVMLHRAETLKDVCYY